MTKERKAYFHENTYPTVNVSKWERGLYPESALSSSGTIQRIWEQYAYKVREFQRETDSYLRYFLWMCYVTYGLYFHLFAPDFLHLQWWHKRSAPMFVKGFETQTRTFLCRRSVFITSTMYFPHKACHWITVTWPQKPLNSNISKEVSTWVVHPICVLFINSPAHFHLIYVQVTYQD